jgi:hypothetical protein
MGIVSVAVAAKPGVENTGFHKQQFQMYYAKTNSVWIDEGGLLLAFGGLDERGGKLKRLATTGT